MLYVSKYQIFHLRLQHVGGDRMAGRLQRRRAAFFLLLGQIDKPIELTYIFHIVSLNLQNY